ncbi:hypothetical protein [Mesorhizobium sp.]|uniref:hypothetical protein n=1 Tax=Mesorhizobium sp. TaxID=1871066 RepID=UPI00257E5238|nr:hypothetical protein [Mesorhizobium sp.]
MNFQPYRSTSVTTGAEKRSLDRAKQRILAIAPNKRGWLYLGVMRAVFAPGTQLMPLAQVAKGDIEACVHAVIDDGLRVGLGLAWCQDPLHHMSTVVVDQKHPRAAPDCGLPGGLADHGIGGPTDRLDKLLFVAIPNFNPKIVFCPFCHRFAGRRFSAAHLSLFFNLRYVTNKEHIPVPSRARLTLLFSFRSLAV